MKQKEKGKETNDEKMEKKTKLMIFEGNVTTKKNLNEKKIICKNILNKMTKSYIEISIENNSLTKANVCSSKNHLECQTQTEFQ